MKRKTLFDFGIKAKHPRGDDIAPVESTIREDKKIEHHHPICSKKESETSTDPVLPSSFDIAAYIGKISQLSPDALLNILNNAFVPDDNFDWPYSTRMSRGKPSKRFLKKEHFTRCPSLTFSVSQQGLYCRHCVLFGPSERSGHHSGQKLGKLVKIPLDTYSHMFGADGYIDAHIKTTYHAEALLKADDFKHRIAQPSLQVGELLVDN